MQAKFQVSDKLEITLEFGNQAELVQQLSIWSEIFGHNKCGACHKPDIRFVVREVAKGNKKFKYHELHCTNPSCRSKLAFGQHNEGGTLFPKRKDDQGNYLPNGGWTKWKPEGEDKQEEKPASF